MSPEHFLITHIFWSMEAQGKLFFLYLLDPINTHLWNCISRSWSELVIWFTESFDFDRRQTSLFQVLKAFSLYDPDIGYSQVITSRGCATLSNLLLFGFLLECQKCFPTSNTVLKDLYIILLGSGSHRCCPINAYDRRGKSILLEVVLVFISVFSLWFSTHWAAYLLTSKDRGSPLD